MSEQSNKYHLTQSLLSSWLYSYKTEDGYERFLKALRRVKEPPTPAMLDGIKFENCVNNFLDGAALPAENPWFHGIIRTADRLVGSQKQVNLRRDIIVDGVCFELNGVLDFLKAGVIYDTKFSKHYYLNKYLHSPQHPLYFYLVPEAYEFNYLSCDGRYLFTETYRPEDCTPIEVTIRQFMRFLDKQNLVDEFASIYNLETYYKKKEIEK